MAGGLRILIVGGGIGGCSAAIAFSASGHDVTVIEKQDEWQFHSSGIFVYSNGLQSLKGLGVLDEILSAGFVIPEGRNLYFEADGVEITQTIYPEGEGGVPAILGIKRAELHRVLATRMEALGIEVRLGTTAEALEQTGDAVTVRLSDGTEERARLVIGADGLRSQVRRLIGIELEPRYTGFGVWRAVHHRPLDLVDKIMQMGHGKRLGIMPISQSHLYTFGTIPEPGEAWYAPEDWPGLMQSKFSEFGGPVGPLLAELSEESDVIYTAVEEVILPLPWHRGNVVLIGDAAHASTPFMGQGGAMAMQDAVVLAGLFATRSVPDALEAFGAMRAPVCRFVQDVSRKVGEAGAAEDAAGLSGRRERMQQNAQADVDHFYTELGRLSAVALAEHDLAT